MRVCVCGGGGGREGGGGGGINRNRYFNLIGREISLILFQSFGLGDGGFNLIGREILSILFILIFRTCEPTPVSVMVDSQMT